jgi:2-dehydropantoate 2-reductase
MNKRTYAILGTGALGGFYGAKLQKSGLEVHYLLKSDYQQVSEQGLIIESKDGDFTLPQVNAYNHVDKMPRCDVVIVSLKTTQNQLLPNLLPPIVKDDGVVLVLQNGIDIEVEIAEIVSNVNIIGGLW